MEPIIIHDLPESFLLEVIFRSTIMFTVLLLTLKVAGKRGVKQLSVFETVIIGICSRRSHVLCEVGIIPP
jgi:hypothetical protein